MANGNVRKIDHLLSEAFDLPLRSQGAERRYLICSTPRSGSNLVSRMLQDTEAAGVPMEYLNPRYMAGMGRRFGWTADSSPTLQGYLRALESRRTSGNGYFGLKMHYDHMHRLFAESARKAAPFLKRFDVVLALRRRDKIAQAVSLYRARKTQIWSSSDRQYLAGDAAPVDVDFNPVAIAEQLRLLLWQEARWDALFSAAGIAPPVFWYEDFVDDFTASSERALSALGLEREVTSIPAPTLKRQAASNDDFRQSFVDLLGLQR